MAKFKRYDYSQKVLIPVSLEEQLVPGSLGFAINTLIETRMDMSVFEGKYKNDQTSRSAYNPTILLKSGVVGLFAGIDILSANWTGVLRECDLYGAFG